jgi:hypothetical protein
LLAFNIFALPCSRRRHFLVPILRWKEAEPPLNSITLAADNGTETQAMALLARGMEMGRRRQLLLLLFFFLLAQPDKEAKVKKLSSAFLSPCHPPIVGVKVL